MSKPSAQLPDFSLKMGETVTDRTDSITSKLFTGRIVGAHPHVDMQKPLTVKELADFYSVSINTVYWWASGLLFPKIKAGRHLRFDLSKVNKISSEGKGI